MEKKKEEENQPSTTASAERRIRDAPPVETTSRELRGNKMIWT